MDIKQLFKIQEIMENNIKQYAQMEEDALGIENVSDLRFLALQVKTGELTNSTKCYKYSRVKLNISKEKLLIKYIDAMKFLLSIGNVYEFNIIDKESIEAYVPEYSLVKVFSSIYEDIVSLKYHIDQKDYVASLSVYICLFSRYLNVAQLLGYSFDEVYNYYLENYNNK